METAVRYPTAAEPITPPYEEIKAVPQEQKPFSQTYKDAVTLLRYRLRPFRSGPAKNVPNNFSMREWLAELGYEDPSVLNVIHITGTKGKGSTAAFTEAFLRSRSNSTRPIKVGLYTSPHLVTERERIKINSQPISEELFASTFFEMWDTLFKNRTKDQMPGYLQLLALLSVVIFMREGVDIAIYEVHAGGRKDSTNVFERPVVAGFTTIGLDHVDLLGGSVESIAWHKSGLMKVGKPAFSMAQPEVAVRAILKDEASKIGSPLEFVDINNMLPEHRNIKLFVQKQNASLAIKLANAYLNLSGEALSEADIEEGVRLWNWPGRFQRVNHGISEWFLDCAHNSISIPVALSWYISEVRSDSTPKRKAILVFGHESSRDTYELISMIETLCSEHKFSFDLVILTPYDRYGKIIHSSGIVEEQKYWQTIQPLTNVTSATSLAHAIAMAEERYSQDQRQILITGSTHLVGDALSLMQEQDKAGSV